MCYELKCIKLLRLTSLHRFHQLLFVSGKIDLIYSKKKKRKRINQIRNSSLRLQSKAKHFIDHIQHARNLGRIGRWLRGKGREVGGWVIGCRYMYYIHCLVNSNFDIPLEYC